MNKIIVKSLAVLIITVAVLIGISTVSNAASLSITTSKSSVAPGEVFTATITLNGGAGPISASVQNGSGSATQFLDNGSMSVSCTAGSSGTVTVSASGTVGDYTTEADVYVSNSKGVTIVEPVAETPKQETQTTNKQTQTTQKNNNSNNTTKKTETPTKSSDSKLATLEVAEGTLSPEFDSSTTEYQITVPNDITKLTINATPSNSKATIAINGNEELQEGENVVEVVVTAENGNTTTYKMTTIRELPELNLKTLDLYYINEDGKKVKLVLEPEFQPDIYDYKIKEELLYTISSINVESIATREDAEIEITGNEKLQEGKNTITIKVSLTSEEGDIEERIYKVIVNKEKEPVVVPLTTAQKIQLLFSNIGSWTTNNFDKLLSILLLISTTAFVGLTIYFIYDYNNYKKIMEKLAEVNKANLKEKANVALNVEDANTEEEEETSNEVDNAEEAEEIEEDQDHKSNVENHRKRRRGRRFRE